jgi:hypothetical protein
VGGHGHVSGDFGRAQVRPLLVDGNVHFAEFQLSNNAQGPFERILGEAQRRTRDEHGCLRLNSVHGSAAPSGSAPEAGGL